MSIIAEIDKKINAGEIGNVPGTVNVFQVIGIKVPTGVAMGASTENIQILYPKITSNNYLEVLNLLKSDPEWDRKYREQNDKFLAIVTEAKKLKENNADLVKKYESSLKNKKISNLKKERNELKQGYKIVNERELGQKFGGKNNESENFSDVSAAFLIQMNITRFGPLLLVLFFVSILVNLYRYNIRLSGYYDARADGLELLELDINESVFEKLVSTVSPEQYDFGKTPLPPAEYAAQLAKTLADKSK